MITLITILHVFVCIFLILVILLQAGKGGGMGAGLGGGGAQSVFGGRGSQTFLSKVTSVSAAVFMITSLTLAFRSSKSGSVTRELKDTTPASSAPAAPPAAPPAPPVQPEGATK